MDTSILVDKCKYALMNPSTKSIGIADALPVLSEAEVAPVYVDDRKSQVSIECVRKAVKVLTGEVVEAKAKREKKPFGLPVSLHVQAVLRKAGIENVDDLRRYIDDGKELSEIDGVGAAVEQRITRALEDLKVSA